MSSQPMVITGTRKGKMQINVGLITNSEGFPLKIEVFEGNVNDHLTVLGQINSIKKNSMPGRLFLLEIAA